MTDVPAYEGAVPAVPEIEPQERWEGAPFLLADVLVAIGWQWLPAEHGGPSFVVARRTRTGTLKVTEQYPMSAGGWAAAWQALAVASTESARRNRAALENRAAASQERTVRAAAPDPLDWRAAARLIDPAQLRDAHVIRLDAALTLRASAGVITAIVTIAVAGLALPVIVMGNSSAGASVVVFGAVVALAVAVNLLRGLDVFMGRTTVVSPTGISWRRLQRRHHYRWGDITAVYVDTTANADSFFGGPSLGWGKLSVSYGKLRVQLTLNDGRQVRPIAPAGFSSDHKAFWAAASDILAYWSAYHLAG